MQACYVNTTHPDFLNGHKAMAIVQERMNANKPQPAVDPKTKLAPGQVNNNKDLDVEVRQNDNSFFGSFFSSGSRNGRPVSGVKKGGASTPTNMEAPPPVIKPQAALSERETMETEVISELRTSSVKS